MYNSAFTRTHFNYQVQAIQSSTWVKLYLLWGLIENQKHVSNETGEQTWTKRHTWYSRTAGRNRLIGQGKETRSTYIFHKPWKISFLKFVLPRKHSVFTSQDNLARCVNIVKLNDEEMTGHIAGNVNCGGASRDSVTVDVGPYSMTNILIEPF